MLIHVAILAVRLVVFFFFSYNKLGNKEGKLQSGTREYRNKRASDEPTQVILVIYLENLIITGLHYAQITQLMRIS